MLSLSRESGNQTRALDNQIRLLQGNLRRAAVGKKFKAADFVDDAVLGHSGHLGAKMIGNNQRARRRLKLRLGFHYANRTPAAGYAGGGEESGCRSSYDDDFTGVIAVPWLGLAFFHSPVGSQWCKISPFDAERDYAKI